ncbi:MAG TPA: HAD-IC family P-type ATPase [Candidatus Udaeobacter sp.]|nr:HAD-IC family P-type ATPase [Candidatus Udaeobacter sp.]
MENQSSWHSKTIPEVLEAILSREQGLTNQEAKKRLQEHGLNKLPESKEDSLCTIFLRQFQSPLIYILLLSSIVVLLLGEKIDAIIIMIVLVFNAIIGAIQEGKAQNTLRALKQFAETSATVIRDGKEIIIKDTEVVLGDIILLQEGEKVPADARIIFANTLKIDEASLTGESEPVVKTNNILSDKSLLITDQKNILFKGTNILSGNGTAVVVATGLNTEIGKIAQKITAIDTEIPLKKEIHNLSQLIIIIVLVINIFLITTGVLFGNSLKEMFILAVAVAISVIPEGLPIVVTLVLATGVWRMSKHGVLVKRLQAVEALGQTKIIAVDKTGTLTKNEMVVEEAYTDGKFFKITGNGYEPKGEIFLDGEIINPANHPELTLSGKIAAFCVNAKISSTEETNTWKVSGDPTEAALLVFSEKIGFNREITDQETPKILELPFNYQNKYHATIRSANGKNFLSVTGAPEKILELCKNIQHENKIEILNADKKTELESIFNKMAASGLRVVACAANPDIDTTAFDPDNLPSLSFIGFFGIKDALRSEVKEAVQIVKSAHIRPIMITGDHRLTALTIAREAGIYTDGDLIISGAEIDAMSDSELAKKLARATVFNRVTPDHKLRIILAYRKRGEIIAMTGDGINDAPSLVAADLGVAMGKIGTEVAKEAADIVLTDDNFSNIVLAAEEGRNIYKTIKKVILYLFSTNLGEVLTISCALLLSFPAPLLPTHIIWLNFITDGFLDVSLAMEPKEKNLLQNNFAQPKKYLVDKLMLQRILLMAVPMTIGTLYLFKLYATVDITKAWTISLTTLAIFQWFNAWNCRHESRSIFRMGILSNKYLAIGTILVFCLQMFVIYNPFMQKFMHTTSLTISEWLIITLVATSVIWVEEIRKFFHRKTSKI